MNQVIVTGTNPCDWPEEGEQNGTKQQKGPSFYSRCKWGSAAGGGYTPRSASIREWSERLIVVKIEL